MIFPMKSPIGVPMTIVKRVSDEPRPSNYTAAPIPTIALRIKGGPRKSSISDVRDEQLDWQENQESLGSRPEFRPLFCRNRN